MHVLITGGAGFIGSHLTQALLARGDSVAVMDDLSTGAFANIQPFLKHPLFSFAIESITNDLVLDRLASQANAIVHLAAAVGVQLVVEQPTRTLETNVIGTHQVLAAARRYRCRTLLASTSEVYGKSGDLPFNEESDLLLGPSSHSRWGYAASKLLDEFLGLAAHREYDLPVTVTRFFNTVGPRQTGRYGMVVPRFVQQALAGQPLTVFGDGEQSRCFCHVGDVIQALLGLLDRPKETAGQVYNIGSQEEVTINHLARSVIQRSKSASEIVYIPYGEAYAPGFEDMRRRIPDISKIQQTIGWQPTRSLNEILDDVIQVLR
jgi:UDP-glucose 4-epimerase